MCVCVEHHISVYFRHVRHHLTNPNANSSCQGQDESEESQAPATPGPSGTPVTAGQIASFCGRAPQFSAFLMDLNGIWKRNNKRELRLRSSIHSNS